MKKSSSQRTDRVKPAEPAGKTAASSDAASGPATGWKRKPWWGKTGPKPGFDRNQVVDAALKIGVLDFRMADVAKHLGVVPSALYREFASRDAIVDACLAKAATAIIPPDATLSWQEQLRMYANSTWQMCEDFPGIAQTIMTTPGAHVHIQSQLRQMQQNLVNAGIPGGASKALFALDFLGELALNTHRRIEIFASLGISNESWIEKAQQRFDRAQIEYSQIVFPPEECWLDHSELDARVECVINGLEHN